MNPMLLFCRLKGNNYSFTPDARELTISVIYRPPVYDEIPVSQNYYIIFKNYLTDPNTQ